MVSSHDADPGKAEAWLKAVEDDRRIVTPKSASGRLRLGGGVGLYMPMVQQFLEEPGILIPESALFDIAAQAAMAGMRAKERLARIAENDYSDDPAEGRYPKWEDVRRTLSLKSETLSVAVHFEEYAKSRAAASGRKYRINLLDLGRFLGNPNLALATPDDIQAWVDDLVTRTVGEGKEARRRHSDKGIADGYLTAARSFYKWGVRKKKLKFSPAADIRHEFRKKPKTRQPYFVDKEVKLILSESLREPSGRESTEFRAAKRWVPWLCAYTGARITEIIQLRSVDVVQRDYHGEEVWTINITPEAGRVKNGTAREVPLHEHLIAQGFIDFVTGVSGEHLFYDPKRRRGGSEANPPSAKVGQKIGEWVRKIGVPTGVAPNHGWRHRFNAVARRNRLIPEIRDAIKGHEPRTGGEECGGYVEWDMMWPEIKLLPRIEVMPATASGATSAMRSPAARRRMRGPPTTRAEFRQRAKINSNQRSLASRKRPLCSHSPPMVVPG